MFYFFQILPNPLLDPEINLVGQDQHCSSWEVEYNGKSQSTLVWSLSFSGLWDYILVCNGKWSFWFLGWIKRNVWKHCPDSIGLSVSWTSQFLYVGSTRELPPCIFAEPASFQLLHLSWSIFSSQESLLPLYKSRALYSVSAWNFNKALELKSIKRLCLNLLGNCIW